MTHGRREVDGADDVALEVGEHADGRVRQPCRVCEEGGGMKVRVRGERVRVRGEGREVRV